MLPLPETHCYNSQFLYIPAVGKVSAFRRQCQYIQAFTYGVSAGSHQAYSSSTGLDLLDTQSSNEPDGPRLGFQEAGENLLSLPRSHDSLLK